MSRLCGLALVGFLVVAGGPLACGAAEEEAAPEVAAEPEVNEGRAALSGEALAQLDSGNVAYSAQALEDALRHYQRVTELAPEQASGWFGIYMAQTALGNTEAADEAFDRAQSFTEGEIDHPGADSAGG